MYDILYHRNRLKSHPNPHIAYDCVYIPFGKIWCGCANVENNTLIFHKALIATIVFKVSFSIDFFKHKLIRA